MKAPENNRKSLESIFLASILNLCIAVFFVSAVGCGNWPVGRESVAKKQYWEGVGIWGQPAETAPLSVVSGWVRDTPGLTTKIGGAVWTVESVEDISKGLARVWPSVDYRWVVIRMRIEYDTPVTERVPYNLKKLVLGESISMEDDDGYKHFPCQVHLRLVPNIFKIIELDTDGITVPLIFPLKRGLKPVSVEIHDPLNSGKLTWWHPGEPSDWYSIDKNIEIASQGMRRLWEIHLDKVLYEQSPPSSDFKTKLSFRNITFDTLPSPNLALARLYLGSGKTLLSSDTPQITEVDPGKAVERILTFNNVPEHESIDVVVPYRNHWARFNAYPGYQPEKPVSLQQKAVSGGLNVYLYDFVDTGTDFKLRYGMLNKGGADFPLTGLKIWGLTNSKGEGPSAIPGRPVDPPQILYTGFEERRWVEFSRKVSGIQFDIPNREPVVLYW